MDKKDDTARANESEEPYAKNENRNRTSRKSLPFIKNPFASKSGSKTVPLDSSKSDRKSKVRSSSAKHGQKQPQDAKGALCSISERFEAKKSAFPAQLSSNDLDNSSKTELKVNQLVIKNNHHSHAEDTNQGKSHSQSVCENVETSGKSAEVESPDPSAKKKNTGNEMASQELSSEVQNNSSSTSSSNSRAESPTGELARDGFSAYPTSALRRASTTSTFETRGSDTSGTGKTASMTSGSTSYFTSTFSTLSGPSKSSRTESNSAKAGYQQRQASTFSRMSTSHTIPVGDASSRLLKMSLKREWTQVELALRYMARSDPGLFVVDDVSSDFSLWLLSARSEVWPLTFCFEMRL